MHYQIFRYLNIVWDKKPSKRIFSLFQINSSIINSSIINLNPLACEISFNKNDPESSNDYILVKKHDKYQIYLRKSGVFDFLNQKLIF